jgi:hypothetical protein
MALWHIEYFQLEEFREMAEAGRSLSCGPAFPLKQVVKPSSKRHLPYTQRNTFVSEDPGKNLSKHML